MSLIFRCNGCKTELEEDSLITVRVSVEVEKDDDYVLDEVCHLCTECISNTSKRSRFLSNLGWQDAVEAIKLLAKP